LGDVKSPWAATDYWVTIKWVADGDTVYTKGGKSIRYIGINSPEIDHEKKVAEPFGYEARKLNRDLVHRKRVRLEFDTEKADRYGRLLAYVYLPNGTFVNQSIVREGMAHVIVHKKTRRYAEILLDAQRLAMKDGKGIWKHFQKIPETLVGNLRSKRFHDLSCPSSRKIKQKNRRFFSSQWDAFWQGYAPCRKCATFNQVDQ
jgi:micrococcal nuclease